MGGNSCFLKQSDIFGKSCFSHQLPSYPLLQGVMPAAVHGKGSSGPSGPGGPSVPSGPSMQELKLMDKLFDKEVADAPDLLTQLCSEYFQESTEAAHVSSRSECSWHEEQAAPIARLDVGGLLSTVPIPQGQLMTMATMMSMAPIQQSKAATTVQLQSLLQPSSLAIGSRTLQLSRHIMKPHRAVMPSVQGADLCELPVGAEQNETLAIAEETAEAAPAFVPQQHMTSTESTAAWPSHDINQTVQPNDTCRSTRSKRRGTGPTIHGNFRSNDTTLIMHNLPVDYSHGKTQGLLDGLGFRDRYDVVIWFARKLSGARQLSHAIVNFKTPRDCESFRQRLKDCCINPSGEPWSNVSKFALVHDM